MAGWFSDFIDGFMGSAAEGAATGAVKGSSDSLFGGSTVGKGLSAALPYVIQGGLSYFGGQNKSESDSKLLKDKQAFDSAEADKQRAFEKELLQMKLAEAAGAGGGGGGGMDKQILVNALQGQANTELAGGQLKISTLADMLAAIQRGLGQVR
jgi:hypothetical protein